MTADGDTDRHLSALAPTVTLDVWRIPARDVARAMIATVDHARRLRRRPDVRFAKVLGTADARFRAGRADLTRWVVLTVWDGPDTVDTVDTVAAQPSFARHAHSHWQARLAPLASRGRWSGSAPFDLPTHDVASAWAGPVLALTRARLRPVRAVTFWRAVPPVALALAATDGLDAAFGVGEAPVGVQGTVSLWRDAAAVRAFARRDPAHRAVVARTPVVGWYAEELFARLAVVTTSGAFSALAAR